MLLSLLGTHQDRPGIWAPPLLQFFPVLVCQLSQCCGMWHSACRRHQNVAGAHPGSHLEFHPVGQPTKGSLWTGVLSLQGYTRLGRKSRMGQTRSTGPGQGDSSRLRGTHKGGTHTVTHVVYNTRASRVENTYLSFFLHLIKSRRPCSGRHNWSMREYGKMAVNWEDFVEGQREFSFLPSRA